MDYHQCHTDFGIACKEGYRQFLYPMALPKENKSHNWSFLYPLGSLTLGTGYSTGTIAVALSGITGNHIVLLSGMVRYRLG